MLRDPSSERSQRRDACGTIAICATQYEQHLAAGKKMNKMSCSLGPLCSAGPLGVFTALLGEGVVLWFILAAESRIQMNRPLSASVKPDVG